MKAVAVGVLAQAALGRAGDRARVLARLSASTWLTAGGEIVWLGAATATLHPRAILVPVPCGPFGDEVTVDASGLAPWRPSLPAPQTFASMAVRERWRRMVPVLVGLHRPAGFGALLAGAPVGFPLTAARNTAEELARACARDDPAAVVDAAVALLGLGEGLTPSGDDYVGGALFVRHLLAAGGGESTPAWRGAAEAILAAAPARTHPISIALLGDLASGLGWAPLHDLVTALARADDEAAGDLAALAAARHLVRLGHTSGWDVLAGLGAGLGELAGIARA